MAKYNLEAYLDKDGLGFPLNFRRGNPNPLDNSSVWKSLAEAQNYAQTDPTAYVGQILSVVNYTPAVTDEEGQVITASQSTVEVYYIKDEAGALEPVGTSPVGDEGTITVAEDGTVSLYGIAGLALTREDEDGETVNITYQPLYVNGKLTWVEPSATTVEGLAAEIEGLKTRISALETAVGDAEGGLVKDVADNAAAIKAINDKIGEVAEDKTVVEMIADAQDAATYDDTALANRVKATEDAIGVASADGVEASGLHARIEGLEVLVGEESVSVQIAKETTRAEGVESGLAARLKVVEDDYLKAADKTELSDAIDAAEESAVNRILGYLAEEEVNASYDTLKEVAAWIESDTTNSAELIGRVSAIEGDYLKASDKEDLQGEVDALGEYVGDIPEGATAATVVEYIGEAIDGLNIADYAKAADLNDLAERVTTAEGEIDALGTLVGEKPVSEQIATAIADKVDKAEGYRLMSDTEGAKLEGIAAGANVNVIDTVDEAQFAIENKHLTLLDIAMGKVTGLSDALEGKVDKVEGSRLLTEDEATKLEKLVLGENGEVSVSGKVAAGNVDGLDAWITARAATLKGLSENNLTDTLLAKLNSIAEGAQVNVIDTVSDEFTITGKNLAINAISQDKITGLSDALDSKVNAEDGYRLISEVELERIAGIADGAQVNVLEGVQINGTLLDIADKKVNIPVATAEKLGVVMASNEVTVADSGVLGIGTISVAKIVNDNEYVLVLDGGTSAK